ncbi:MFS transporter [Nocardioides hwasunensis]|uniref:MFS transporter n=1 Tax=Nocardioides hwasunensis TaxID=397258 RepID=A0ABR8MMS0_9ACTN|nr:MFS transporter [Nocardioides hwasunensis]MBD3916102.1 MFS transporter [Nocardioides hwasunensis]
MSWSASLAPLAERNFAWYFSSRLVNTLGAMMANIALTFAVLDIDGRAIAIGQVLAAHTIPMILLLLWGGVISDRFPRAVVLQVSNVLSALSQGAIAVLVLTGTAELWMIIVLAAAHGAVSAVSMPAMAGLVPQLVPREALQQANALLSLTRNGLTVLGPSLGAFIVVTSGPGWALAVDALTWVAAAVLLAPVRIPPKPAKAEATSTWQDLREGWTFFRSVTWLWVVVLGFGGLNMIHNGALFTLGPVVAEDTIGRQAWGFVLSAEALGLLVMAVVLLRFRLERPLLWGMASISAMALPMLMLGIEPVVVALVAAAFVGGMGIEVFSMGWALAMQENIDDDMLARAYSYDMLGSFIAMPIGQLLWGPLGELLGNEEVLVASGVAYVAICGLVLCSRSVRTLQRAPHAPAQDMTTATP